MSVDTFRWLVGSKLLTITNTETNTFEIRFSFSRTPALSVQSVCLSISSMLSSCREKKRPPDNAYYVMTGPRNPKKNKMVVSRSVLLWHVAQLGIHLDFWFISYSAFRRHGIDKPTSCAWSGLRVHISTRDGKNKTNKKFKLQLHSHSGLWIFNFYSNSIQCMIWSIEIQRNADKEFVLVSIPVLLRDLFFF